MYMQKQPPFNFTKPYDLRDRLFEYACAIVHVTQYLHTRDDVARSLADQILRAGNSAGANYEEADDGSSPADTRGKRRISLRELKEALFRLRVVRAVSVAIVLGCIAPLMWLRGAADRTRLDALKRVGRSWARTWKRLGRRH
jgi:four helix bundle protein